MRKSYEHRPPRHVMVESKDGSVLRDLAWNSVQNLDTYPAPARANWP